MAVKSMAIRPDVVDLIIVCSHVAGLCLLFIRAKDSKQPSQDIQQVPAVLAGWVTISGFTGRWRDCNLSELLRQLHRSDQRSFPASEFRAQSQYLSKIKDVMIALRACVTLSDADIDVDVGGTLKSLIAAAKDKYGDIFYGSIRSVYNRLLSARKE